MKILENVPFLEISGGAEGMPVPAVARTRPDSPARQEQIHFFPLLPLAPV